MAIVAWAPGQPVSAASGLGVLTFSATTFTLGTAASGQINGATTGTTITATGLPAGVTINSALRTWAYDGTGAVGNAAIGLTETPAGSASPKTSTVNVAIISKPGAVTLGAVVASNGTLTIPWADGATNGAPIDGRYYAIGTVAGGEGPMLAATITGGNLVITGLTNGTTYFVKGYAHNAVGTSPVSNEATGKPAAPAATGGNLDFSDPNNSALLGTI